MTLPLPLAPVPLAPVTVAPVPLAPVPVAAAIIEFRGFPPGPLGTPPRAFLLADAGDPPRTARWFETALANALEPGQFAAACLRTAPAPLGPLEGASREGWMAAYRYRLGLGSAGGGLRLQCWRCYGEEIGWQRRCGPMALGAFVAHFGAKGAAAGNCA